MSPHIPPPSYSPNVYGKLHINSSFSICCEEMEVEMKWAENFNKFKYNLNETKSYNF